MINKLFSEKFLIALKNSEKPKTEQNDAKAKMAVKDWRTREDQYRRFSENHKTAYVLKRGEIYEIDWGCNVNAEFSNRHFGVVLADSNANNPLVIVCPLKTNKNGCHPASDVDLGFVGALDSRVPTLAVANQIRTIDKFRIYTRGCINTCKSSPDGGVFGEEDIRDEGSVIPVLNEDKVREIIEKYNAILNPSDSSKK